VLNYATGPAKALDAIPHLYFMDPIEGRDREGHRIAPHFGVNISAHFDKKRAMLQCHRSQIGWVVKQHGIDDFTAAMEKWSTKQGRLFGVPYAEGFRQYTGTPYPRSPLLQELAGAALRTLPI
jgi:LmbE family N-acetylglucosaminyl deacetylase